MNFFVGGTYDWPEENFRFLFVRNKDGNYEFTIDELSGGITLVDFSLTGWDAAMSANAIYDNILRSGYERVRIFTLSVGDQVARELEAAKLHEVVNWENIAINPCPSFYALQLQWKITGMIAVPVVRVIDVALGWASILPILPQRSGRWYSPWLITDQGRQLLCRREEIQCDRTIGVVLSEGDQFLDNARLKLWFGQQKIITIKAGHADTFERADLYREKVQEILQHGNF